ncbi:hypothetical protein A8709_27815 [Paenibacillus pectinilyticus]|uniref:Sporulation membrane protein YtrI C-terminal domain-containing protein n=1 Tax=Paenibacillus pectinilyticus TaxID=512399 RepID=A0A1C0ZUA1_9BACL|nr:hypothetical protein [Paenibacillus pectinilyticus]OCT11685.1 hypothetical protein A8709_27815 [Paenibacillus pectinilyticus]
MRIPPFARYQRLLASFGIFVSGAIVGSAVYMSIHQHTYNELYVQMHKYLEENHDLRADIDNLNKTKNKQTLINVINVHLLPKSQTDLISEDIQKEIEGDVKGELKLVIGQKATTVRDSQALYERLITQRTYFLHDKKYVVEVKSIILIQTEMTVWITAEEKKT